MNAHVTVGPFRLRRIGASYWATASSAIVALALASGMAAAFGTVADRLTAYGGAANAASGASPSLPPLRIADRRDAAPGAPTHAYVAHVVDRWFDEPEVATMRTTALARPGANPRATLGNVGRGVFQSLALPDDRAPNETRGGGADDQSS
jgi:hypothetical protein